MTECFKGFLNTSDYNSWLIQAVTSRPGLVIWHTEYLDGGPVHMWADVSTYFLSFVVVIILSSKQHEDPLHIALTAVHFHY